MYVYIYIYIDIHNVRYAFIIYHISPVFCVSIYIYICIERERDTSSFKAPFKSLKFRGVRSQCSKVQAEQGNCICRSSYRK